MDNEEFRKTLKESLFRICSEAYGPARFFDQDGVDANIKRAGSFSTMSELMNFIGNPASSTLNLLFSSNTGDGFVKKILTDYFRDPDCRKNIAGYQDLVAMVYAFRFGLPAARKCFTRRRFADRYYGPEAGLASYETLEADVRLRVMLEDFLR